jgi:hypothetical protein
LDALAPSIVSERIKFITSNAQHHDKVRRHAFYLVEQVCEVNITGVTGIGAGQKAVLKALGAVEMCSRLSPSQCRLTYGTIAKKSRAAEWIPPQNRFRKST